MKKIPIPPKTPLFEDVTENYLSAAIPGSGSVAYEEGYRVKDHQHEMDMAQWLHCTFGGDITLLKESEEKNHKTADFLWNQKLWELKNASSVNGADKLMQHAIKQIQANPGGIVLNILEDIDLLQLEYQLARRFKRGRTSRLDLIVLMKGRLVKVLRYRK